MNLDTFLDEPTHRRGWLLIKALECVPLDQAIDLARTADRFVMDETSANVVIPERAPATPPARLINADKVRMPTQDLPALPVERTEPSRLPLSQREREELLRRAAKGAKNAELAIEFGLTPRQVQGLRMGASRGAWPLAEEPKAPDQAVIATSDEVVRYLRQRDDVVVSDGDGGFLVNGRFRLGLAELVAKANRARARQNKPPFTINEPARDASPDTVRNGHPLSWSSANGESH